jgi:general secretion pathway protein G
MPNNDKNKPVHSSGFTIVELLVVIVVIGILAAVTIVAYTGINQRAVASSLSADLGNMSKQLKLDQITNGAYPATLADANGGKGITACLGTTSCQYTVDNNTSPPTFCITATKSNQSYYISQDGKPTAGGCSGDVVAGVPAITNLVSNPSFENGTKTGYNNNDSLGTYTVVNDSSMAGTHVLHFLSSSTITQINVGIYTQVYNISSSEPAYTISAWLRTSRSLRFHLVAERRNSSGTLLSGVGSNYVTIPANTWTRLTFQMPTITDIDRFTYCIYSASESWVPGDWVDYDGLMVTKGTDIPNYADGNSHNWAWSGTANISTSTGPAI